MTIDEFSPQQINVAMQALPALARYLEMSRRPTIDLSSQLRCQRHKAWITAALRTFYKTDATAWICHQWSLAAAECLRQAYRASGLADQQVAMFCLGKLGAQELNLSSDVDLMLVSDVPKDGLENSLRKFQNLVAEVTDFGFCHRVDFDLRPGGRSAPLCVSLDYFENHYWSQGETWERLALVRLSLLDGPAALSSQVLAVAEKFSFRKYLDFSLLGDLKVLRSRIHAHNSRSYHPELNIKLRVGGIRDIELLVHSLQVLNGGRDVTLRTRSTTEALTKLGERNLLSAGEVAELKDSYWRFRHFENAIQIREDLHSHYLPEKADGVCFLAEDLVDLKSRFQKVDHIVSSLLGRVNLDKASLPSPDHQDSWLAALGYDEATRSKIWPAIFKYSALSHRTQRDEVARQEFLLRIVEGIASDRGDRNLAMQLLLDFIKSTRAKASFYSLLISQPRLLEDLIKIFSSSVYLSHLLISRPELLDSLLTRTAAPFSNDLAQLGDELEDFKLLNQIISGMEFLKTLEIDALATNLTTTADRITGHLLTALKLSIEPESGLQILALGSWGSREMGLSSDLDLVFVLEGTPQEKTHRIARRWMHRLTDSMHAGRLYNLDLRLRPDGSSGVLILQMAQLEAFLKTRAEAWQRQSYLRARWVETSLGLNPEWMFFKPLTTKDLQELKDIRLRLLKPDSALDDTRSAGGISLKHSQGGLIDCELCVQTLALLYQIQVDSGKTEALFSQLSEKCADKESLLSLQQNYAFLKMLEQLITLMNQFAFKEISLEDEAFKKSALILNEDPQDLWMRLKQVLKENCHRIKSMDPIWIGGTA